MTVQHEFDKYDKRGAYHWKWYATNTDQYYELVNRTLSYFPEPGSILDIGCGDGLISYQLFLRGFEVLGIDPVSKAIELGNRKIASSFLRRYPLRVVRGWLNNLHILETLEREGITLKVQSIYDLDESQRFDYALCHDVIEHVADPSGLVERMMRAIKKFAIVTTPNGAYNSPGPYDYHFWDPQAFVDLFSGYRVELIEENKKRICARVAHLLTL